MKQTNKKMNVKISIFLFFVFMILFFNNIALISAITEKELAPDITVKSLGEITREINKRPEDQILDVLEDKNKNLKIDKLLVSIKDDNKKADISVADGNTYYKKDTGKAVEVSFVFKKTKLSEVFANQKLGEIKLSSKNKKDFLSEDLLNKILEKNPQQDSSKKNILDKS